MPIVFPERLPVDFIETAQRYAAISHNQNKELLAGICQDLLGNVHIGRYTVLGDAGKVSTHGGAVHCPVGSIQRGTIHTHPRQLNLPSSNDIEGTAGRFLAFGTDAEYKDGRKYRFNRNFDCIANAYNPNIMCYGVDNLDYEDIADLSLHDRIMTYKVFGGRFKSKLYGPDGKPTLPSEADFFNLRMDTDVVPWYCKTLALHPEVEEPDEVYCNELADTAHTFGYNGRSIKDRCIHRLHALPQRACARYR